MSSSESFNYFVHTLLRARDWQHRPQFDQVCDWWSGGGQGVCALVGMGGAGKTAIADRFLNELLDDASTTRQRVSAPDSVLVYSFYNDDKPETFFRHLQVWLEGTSAPDKQKSPTQLMFDIQQHQGLIILDGVEKVQESGARGGFGRLTSPSLRDLLNHIASGSARELSVLVTSRFPLTDLRDSQPRFFHTIAVDQLDVPAGIALLRSRAVRGTDVQLAPIVEHCGRHALTIDLAGGYIKEYGHGDPSAPLKLGTAEELQAEAEQEPDDEKRAVLKQGIRFARIAQRYREAMLDTDEPALALLERICLFRLGVDCDMLAVIFTGSRAEKVSGKALASLDADQLQKKLDWLVWAHLVEANQFQDSDHHSLVRYTVHPAVREGFRSGISQRAEQASHDAIRQGLRVSLGQVPGRNPSDPTTLDLLEEIIHHTLQSGYVNEAWELYYYEMGKYENLGWRLGAYERGERICRAFAGGLSAEALRRFKRSEFPPSPLDGNADDKSASSFFDLPYDELFEHYQTQFLNEWAMYLQSLGHLAAASRCYELVRELASKHNDLEMTCAADLRLLTLGVTSGRLGARDILCLDEATTGAAFEVLVEELVKGGFDRDSTDWWPRSQVAEFAPGGFCLFLMACYTCACVRASRGEVAAACHNYANALDCELIIVRDGAAALEREPTHPLCVILYNQFLGQLGRLEEARQLGQDNQNRRQRTAGISDELIPKVELVRCTLQIASGDLLSAERLCASAQSWAWKHGAADVLCLSYLMRARITWSRIQANIESTRSQNCVKQLQDGELETEAEPMLARVRNWFRHRGPSQSDDHNGGTRPRNEPARHVTMTPVPSWTIRDELSAESDVAQGLKIARDCGYGLYHIDLLLERARLHLLRGDAGAALDDIEVALDTGIPANEETGQVELLAANHEECGYAWAIPAGLQLRAEALLLQAAQTLGTSRVDGVERNEPPTDAGSNETGGSLRSTPATSESEPTALAADSARDTDSMTPKASAYGSHTTDVAELIDLAKQLLHEALNRWHDLRDPEPTEDNNFVHPKTGKEYNYKTGETWQILQDLAGGTLTRYPLEPIVVEEEQQTERTESSKAQEEDRSMTKKHVFLSYCRDNKDEASRLRDNLIAAGESVWWDQDILGGQDWKMEIRKAMRDAYAILVCLSQETAERITSGVYPEVLDAIAAYREHAPGGIFLIPVRLSQCEIPLIEIDGTRTLDRLNYIDLFEANGLDKLIQSIQASSLHP